jgi:mutator protein MutT
MRIYLKFSKTLNKGIYFMEHQNYSFQVRVTGILINNNQILIVKQRLSDKRPWSLPGGRLERGESMEQAIIRELSEETGLIVAVDTLLYLCDVPPMSNIIHVTFLLKYIGGEICLPDNRFDENLISDVRFVNIRDLIDYGFSKKFIDLVINDFPNKGHYMGNKSNIGLDL